MNVLSRIFLVLFLLTSQITIARAGTVQESGALYIGAPDIRSFPSIAFSVDAYDARGDFLDGLSVEDIEILEDGKAIVPSSVDTVQNGLQVIIAINTSPSMSTIKDNLSGYQHIQIALQAWIEKQPASTPDDFSLSTSTGLFLIREREPAQASKAIVEYQPDLLKTQPSLTGLAEALDLATDPLERPSMKRAILFITPPLAPTNDTAINDLAGRAREIGVRVHTWVIAQANSNGSPASPSLQKLAQDTGGQYSEILPNTPLPDLEPLFKPLRSSYQLTYTSAVRKSGDHRLSMRVRKTLTSMESNMQTFELDILPPNPILLSPPATIERVFTKASANPEEALSPAEVQLQVLIEFPDKRERALKATRLYVNEKLADENTSAPFDRFTWPIDTLSSSGKYLLRVEAVDTIGLSGSSIEFPVEVIVQQPAAASLPGRISSRGVIAIGAIAASGAALALILVYTGNKRRAGRSQQAKEKRLQKDPVTQPVKIRQEPARSKPKKEHSTPTRGAGWPGAAWLHGSPNAPARLVPLDENEQQISGGNIPLTRQEITFGSDPQRATQVLESPTVDSLHARLFRDNEGNFFLADQNSIAGTWINYAPITTAGARLQHGDLIHVGKVMFRFEAAEMEKFAMPEIQVIDLDK